MIKAQLIDLGRQKVNKEISVETLQQFYDEIGRHLMSKEWGLEEVEKDLWEISVGFRTVGAFKIKEIDL
jgi:hypothetical protein